MKTPRDVLITGIGLVSPLGLGFEVFWDSLRCQRSGIVPIPLFAESGLPFQIGGQIPQFDGKDFVQPRKSLKVMSREIQTAYAAAEMAMKHAAIAKGQLEPERLGVVLGSEVSYGEVGELEEVYRHCVANGEFDFERWAPQAVTDIFPLWMLKYLPNMAACHVGIAHDARGPNNSITSGDVSSLLAVMEGADYIRRGLADVVMAGGTGSRLSHAALPFRGDQNVTRDVTDPAAAMKPFDARRSGTVFGEGAGVLILESRAHAEQRGAQPLARVAGFASRSEPNMREKMTGLSIRNAIRGALQSANLEPAAIGHVNANGLSTHHDDQIEAHAIQTILGDVPVTAPKSFFGFLGAGCGVVEFAASLGALLHGEVPITLNYSQADSQCPVRVVRDEPLRTMANSALVLNHNSTGQATAVVITRD